MSSRYFIGDLEIFDSCYGDILLVSWRYLIGVLEKFVGVLEINTWCPGDI